jgi:hypothetical protein
VTLPVDDIKSLPRLRIRTRLKPRLRQNFKPRFRPILKLRPRPIPSLRYMNSLGLSLSVGLSLGFRPKPNKTIFGLKKIMGLLKVDWTL